MIGSRSEVGGYRASPTQNSPRAAAFDTEITQQVLPQPRTRASEPNDGLPEAWHYRTVLQHDTEVTAVPLGAMPPFHQER